MSSSLVWSMLLSINPSVREVFYLMVSLVQLLKQRSWIKCLLNVRWKLITWLSSLLMIKSLPKESQAVVCTKLQAAHTISSSTHQRSRVLTMWQESPLSNVKMIMRKHSKIVWALTTSRLRLSWAITNRMVCWDRLTPCKLSVKLVMTSMLNANSEGYEPRIFLFLYNSAI